MRKHLEKTAYMSGGVAMFSLAAVGALLPILPGVVFLAWGLFLFSKAFPKLYTWIHLRLRHYPKLQSWWTRLQGSKISQ